MDFIYIASGIFFVALGLVRLPEVLARTLVGSGYLLFGAYLIQKGLGLNITLPDF